MRVYKKRGVIIELDGVKLCLDGSSKCDLGFISHAHTDHLVKRLVNHPFLISYETKVLSEYRTGLKVDSYDKLNFNGLSFELINNGHIFGSKSLLVKGSERVLYTSDFTTKSRFFLKGFKPVKCDSLIIETTYGDPHYEFPSVKEVVSEAKDYINDELARGNNLVLNGYALGKAQIISKLVEGYDNVYVDPKVKAINDLCRANGADIPFLRQVKLKASLY